MAFSASPMSRHGKIGQLAFVPDDFDAALKFWTERMGVGPFFLLDHVQFDEIIYKGRSIHVDASIAHGFWGDMHIELIHQHNHDVSSIYCNYRKSRGDGLHHIIVQSNDVDALEESCLENGGVIAMTGYMTAAGTFKYINMGDDGPLIEIVRLDPRFDQLFGYMRREASRWDGNMPIRSIPDEAVWLKSDD